MKRKLWWRLAGIGLLTLLMLANIIPSGWFPWNWRRLDDGFRLSHLLDTLRPGIDLAGGTRLIYQVRTDTWTGGGAETAAESMIRALKQRVDPNNTLNLIWRPIDEDKIEVVIPRATATSSRRADDYQQARRELLDSSVRISDIQQAREQPTPQARRQAFMDLVRGVSAREGLLAELADAHEALLAAEQAARRDPPAAAPTTQDADALTATTAPHLPGVSLELLAAETAYDQALRKVLDTNVRWLDVLHVVQMEPKRRSPRGAETTPLKTLLEEYPDRAAQIERVIRAHDAWKTEKEALDDPNDLKRLLRGTGVLEFHIAVAEGDVLPDQKAALVQGLSRSLEVPGADFKWVQAADPDVAARSGVVTGERLGTPYVLVHTSPDKSMVHVRGRGDWKFRAAYPTRDQLGLPAVGFEFDVIGGERFSELTGRNRERPLAAILDSQVISIATIQARIGTHGIITGNFTHEQVSDLAQKLQAGALPGSLSPDPISESGIGPQLGEVHRKAGFTAAVIAVIAVIGFMLAYYLFPLGVVANIAVLLNLVYILGLMARGSVLPFPGFTFTLPGIAGLALAIGMAVDANVLIYERIREEQDQGAPLRTAVKNGYGKALSAILDSNVTTLITTVILYAVGTPEVKGFAIVLGIGVAASLFTAIVVTRTLLQLGIEYGWVKGRMRMLRLIGVPKVRWVDKRYAFWAASAVLLAGGLFALTRWDSRELFDPEFGGGTKAQFTLREGAALADGGRISDADLERLVRERTELKDASVRAVLMEGADPRQQRFELVTINENKALVEHAISDALQTPQGRAGFAGDSLLAARGPIDCDLLDVWGTIGERGSADRLPANVYPIVEANPRVLDNADVSEYVGGVAIVMDNVVPPASLDDLKARFTARLTGGQFDRLPPTGWKVLGLQPTADGRYARIAYVARSDEDIYDDTPRADNTAWLNNFAIPQVAMVHQSLTQSQLLDSVNSFNASVAADVKLRAIVAMVLALAAVVIYVWVRFGNVLFGLGSIIPLFHDVLFVVGIVGLAKFISRTEIGQTLMIQDFRFDLTMVAAILTTIGYSLNDTIVVFDRIRENRGRLQYVTPKILDDSINQTMSRTLLTGLTTMVAILIMYIFGGEGIHGFCFAMMVGMVVGTYSSIAIAGPFLLAHRLKGATAPAGQGAG